MGRGQAPPLQYFSVGNNSIVWHWGWHTFFLVYILFLNLFEYLLRLFQNQCSLEHIIHMFYKRNLHLFQYSGGNFLYILFIFLWHKNPGYHASVRSKDLFL